MWDLLAHYAGGGFGVGLAFADAAVAAFAFLKLDESFEQTGAAEVRPQRFRDENLGVGNLPEEKIADAHFAAGANQQVGIGQAVCIHVTRETFFGNWCAASVAVL